MNEPHTTPDEPEPREWTPWDVWRVVVKRRWLIANLALLAFVISAVLAFTLTPVYRATCRISIERKGAKILDTDVMAIETGREGYESFYNTQYAILRNQAVIERAVAKLDLENRPRFATDGQFFRKGLFSRLRSDISALVAARDAPAMIDPSRRYRNWVARRLTISPQRNTQLVDISIDSVDPNLAAEVSNAIAEAYIDFSLEKKLDIARQSESFISERIFELRKDIAHEERALQGYAREHGIVTGDDRDVARQHLATLQEAYTKTLGETAARKAAYLSARTADPSSLREVMDDPLIADLNRKIAGKEERYNADFQTYGTAFPGLQKTRQALEDMRESRRQHIHRLAEQVTKSRNEAYKESQARMQELADLVDEAKSRVDALEQAMIEYEQLRFELDRKKTTLQSLLSRRNDMLLAASMGEDTAHNIRIISHAEPPDRVYSPDKTRMLTLGLLIGLLLGVCISVLLEAVDDSLRTSDDVSRSLALPVVGEIPRVATGNGGRERRTRRDRHMHSSPAGSRRLDPALVVSDQPRSVSAEAYRELRTAVMTGRDGDAVRSLFVTSAEPGEGKTTTALNLAAALGQVGRSVLLIDTDLRRSTCHRKLRLSSDQGVVNYLKLDSELRPLMTRTALERVWLVPAGPTPPDPAELLDSARFVEMIRDAEVLRCPETGAPFDHLILDTPPVLSVVDPILIGRHIGCGLLVLRSGTVRRRSAQAALRKLQFGRTKLMGAVLNGVKLDDGRYGYRYYYYYSRGNEQDLSGRPSSPRRSPEAPAPSTSRPALEAHPGGKSKRRA